MLRHRERERENISDCYTSFPAVMKPPPAIFKLCIPDVLMTHYSSYCRCELMQTRLTVTEVSLQQRRVHLYIMLSSLPIILSRSTKAKKGSKLCIYPTVESHRK